MSVVLNLLFILLQLTPVSTENDPVKAWGWWGGGSAIARVTLGHGGGVLPPVTTSLGYGGGVGLTPSYNQPGLRGGGRPTPNYDQVGLWGSSYFTRLEPAWAMEEGWVLHSARTSLGHGAVPPPARTSLGHTLPQTVHRVRRGSQPHGPRCF